MRFSLCILQNCGVIKKASLPISPDCFTVLSGECFQRLRWAVGGEKALYALETSRQDSAVWSFGFCFVSYNATTARGVAKGAVRRTKKERLVTRQKARSGFMSCIVLHCEDNAAVPPFNPTCRTKSCLQDPCLFALPQAYTWLYPPQTHPSSHPVW